MTTSDDILTWRIVGARATGIAATCLVIAATAWGADPITSIFTSNDAFTASLVEGTIAEQLATLNVGIPNNAFTETTLSGGNFCGGCEVIPGTVEVSLDNNSSAFYRFIIDIPFGASDVSLALKFAVDDQAVAFLNGTRITALMTGSNNWGSDFVDGDGLPMLTWPSVDSVTVTDPAILVCGANELLIGVCGNCSSDPTGLAFTGTLSYVFNEESLPADLNRDAVVNGADLGMLLGAWGECPLRGGCAADLNCDQVVNGGDLGLLLAQWTG